MGRHVVRAFITVAAQAPDKKPNILRFMQDDTGWANVNSEFTTEAT